MWDMAPGDGHPAPGDRAENADICVAGEDRLAHETDTINGMHVRRGGSGDAVLVLLHGLGANGDVWNPMLPLIEAEWRGRWLAPDFRGHGRSAPSSVYSIGGYAADIASLLSPNDDIVIAGHSMGGLVALMLATGWFGVRVRHAAVFGLKIDWTEQEKAKCQQLADASVRWFDSEAEAIERYLKVSGLIGLVGPDSAEARSGVTSDGGRYRMAVDPKTNGVVGPDTTAIIRAVDAPFQLAIGTKDVIVSQAETLANDSNAQVFEGLGHNAHVENPQAVWRYVLASLAARGQGGAAA